MVGVDQHYTANFISNMSSIRTTKPFLSVNLNVSEVLCGTLLLITAVNGAGTSNTSTFVLPSLPDIRPVTASLGHQVWKVNGDTLVRVSFEVGSLCFSMLFLNSSMQPAELCINYPVTSYMLELTPMSGKVICLSLGVNETQVLLDILEENKMYAYSVTAINFVGNATTNSERVLCEFSIFYVINLLNNEL